MPTTKRQVSSKSKSKSGPFQIFRRSIASTFSLSTPKSKKKLTANERRKRGNFVAGMALLAAALVAISSGLMGMKYTSHHDTALHTTPTAGLSLGSLSHKLAPANSTVSLSLYENSGSDPVNTVQGNITYDPQRLQLINVSEGTTFAQVAATDTLTPGLVRVARAVTPTAPAVRGSQKVVDLHFKVLQQSDLASVVSVDQKASLLVRSTDSKNILE